MDKFHFKNKVIFILSPEKWGNMRFSKHHYALELANLGNRVFFIEPPDLNCKGIKVKSAEETDLLKIVTYKPLYRAKRFLPGFIYRLLVKFQVKALISKTGVRPDVVWCFDPFRFLNLNWFGAKVKIFFLADLLSIDDFPEEALTADFCLGLSESRLNQLRQGTKPVLFINHGLSSYYVKKAQQRLTDTGSESRKNDRLMVGYIGNLLMETLDRDTMRTVIKSHPEFDFVFWGQYEKGGQLTAFDKPEVFEFIEFLKAQPHVKLRGPVHPDQLSEETEKADLFWVCWKLGVSKMWDGSNPHKILEYLSTGKPLVTHYIDAYNGNDLIDMLPGRNSEGYLSMFNKVIQRISEGENPESGRKRIALALDNSYNKQIERISEYVNQYCFTDS